MSEWYDTFKGGGSSSRTRGVAEIFICEESLLLNCISGNVRCNGSKEDSTTKNKIKIERYISIHIFLISKTRYSSPSPHLYQFYYTAVVCRHLPKFIAALLSLILYQDFNHFSVICDDSGVALDSK